MLKSNYYSPSSIPLTIKSIGEIEMPTKQSQNIKDQGRYPETQESPLMNR